jgi:glutamate/tyrosine decarboxylase-like PLP-dependent enzyme
MTAVPYQQILAALRSQFPQPVSDPVHDAYFVFSILRALEQVDALKGQAPILGAPTMPDYAAAQASRVAEDPQRLEQVIPTLVQQLEGMFIWGHPQSQINVIPHPTIPGIIGVVLASTYNPNLCSDESGRGVSATEVRVTAMAAELLGYDPTKAAGVFTFGGTGGMLYGLKLGLEKALPGSMQRGVREPPVVLTSEHCHYSVLNVAAWLGVGYDQVIHVPTHADNSINVARLEQAAREALRQGKRIAGFVATLGSTDAFGLDDLAAIHALRERLVGEYELDYRPHIHADAAIGWAWSVFNGYDFVENPLGFRGRTVRALAAAHRRIQHLGLADSVAIDFHKTGYAPYISSLVLFKSRDELQLLARSKESMPYLYQTGEHHPGRYTLETSRSGTGPMAALANLLLFGKQGLRALLGHVVEMAEVLREQLESHPDLVVLNGENVGPVTLFRVYPPGVDTFEIKQQERGDPARCEDLRRYNELNRRVFQLVHAEALQGRGVVISLTDCYRHTEYGEPIVALKSYVLSPFAQQERMRDIVEHVLAARDRVLAEAHNSV